MLPYKMLVIKHTLVLSIVCMAISGSYGEFHAPSVAQINGITGFETCGQTPTLPSSVWKRAVWLDIVISATAVKSDEPSGKNVFLLAVAQPASSIYFPVQSLVSSCIMTPNPPREGVVCSDTPLIFNRYLDTEVRSCGKVIQEVCLYCEARLRQTNLRSRLLKDRFRFWLWCRCRSRCWNRIVLNSRCWNLPPEPNLNDGLSQLLERVLGQPFVRHSASEAIQLIVTRINCDAILLCLNRSLSEYLQDFVLVFDVRSLYNLYGSLPVNTFGHYLKDTLRLRIFSGNQVYNTLRPFL